MHWINFKTSFDFVFQTRKSSAYYMNRPTRAINRAQIRGPSAAMTEDTELNSQYLQLTRVSIY